MTFNKYILKSPRIAGKIILAFTDGLLQSIIVEPASALNEKQWKAFADKIPTTESRLNELESIGLSIVTDKPNERIALFCRMFEQFTKVKYKVSKADSGKAKEFSMDENTLKFYFESTDFKLTEKSIGNFCKYHNYILQLMAKTKAGGFPNHWSKEYADKLDMRQLGLYYKHLNTIGFEPKRDRFGNVTDFIKKPA